MRSTTVSKHKYKYKHKHTQAQAQAQAQAQYLSWSWLVMVGHALVVVVASTGPIIVVCSAITVRSDITAHVPAYACTCANYCKTCKVLNVWSGSKGLSFKCPTLQRSEATAHTHNPHIDY